MYGYRFLLSAMIATAALPVYAHDFIEFVNPLEPGLTKEVVWQQFAPEFDCARDGIDQAKEAPCWEWPDGSGTKTALIGIDAAGNRYFYGPVVKTEPIEPNSWHGVWRERPSFDPDGLGPLGGDELVVEVMAGVASTTPEGYPHSDSSVITQGWSFDAVNGVLYIALHFSHNTEPGGHNVSVEGRGVIKVSGFVTVADIIHSYEVDTGNWSFRVPRVPEGFIAADYFDTYWGELSRVGDWSQAQPLKCGYPASAPNVGDHLTVEDSLPTPTPGSGYYYVTAVNYQGQRRYGRQSDGGVLSGRDPAVLTLCE